MLTMQIAVHYRNGSGVTVKGINQGRDLGDPCLSCGV